jgi:hypothetical protein
MEAREAAQLLSELSSLLHSGTYTGSALKTRAGCQNLTAKFDNRGCVGIGSELVYQKLSLWGKGQRGNGNFMKFRG